MRTRTRKQTMTKEGYPAFFVYGICGKYSLSNTMRVMCCKGIGFHNLIKKVRFFYPRLESSAVFRIAESTYEIASVFGQHQDGVETLRKTLDFYCLPEGNDKIAEHLLSLVG